MSAGNYFEAVERVYLAGASQKHDQRTLRDNQQRRLDDFVIGYLVAIFIVILAYAPIGWHALKRDQSLTLIEQTETLLIQRKYEDAYQTSLKQSKSGYKEWMGHVYGAISLTYLDQPQKAEEALTKAISKMDSVKDTLPYQSLIVLFSESNLNRAEIESYFGKLSTAFGEDDIYGKYLKEDKICYPARRIFKRDQNGSPSFSRGKLLACFSDNLIDRIRADYINKK